MDDKERTDEMAGAYWEVDFAVGMGQFAARANALRLSLEGDPGRTDPLFIPPLPWLAEYAHELQERGRRARWPKGLCPDRGDHVPHSYMAAGLGGLWCTARQEDREPGRSERALRGDGGWRGASLILTTMDEARGWADTAPSP